MSSLHLLTTDEARILGLRATALEKFKHRYSHNAESQRTMLGGLRRAARLIDPSLTEETFPWELLWNEDQTAMLRDRLAVAYHAGTVQRDLSAVRMMIDCCYKVGLITFDERERATDLRPLSGEEGKSGPGTCKPGVFLTEDDVARLLVSTANGRGLASTRARDVALISMMASSAARGFEATGVRMEQVHLEEQRLALTLTKGGRPRNAWLHPASVEALQAWIEVRGRSAGYLFVPLASNGRPLIEHGALSPHQARKIIKQRAHEAGLTLTGHDLRRFVVSTLLETNDIALVAGVVGHRNITTTARYDRRPAERQRQAVESLHLPTLPRHPRKED